MKRTTQVGILGFFMENPISNNFSHCPPKLVCQACPALEVENVINEQGQGNPRGPGPDLALGWRLLRHFTDEESEAQTLRIAHELGSTGFSLDPESRLLQLPLCRERPPGSPGLPVLGVPAEGVRRWAPVLLGAGKRLLPAPTSPGPSPCASRGGPSILPGPESRTGSAGTGWMTEGGKKAPREDCTRTKKKSI